MAWTRFGPCSHTGTNKPIVARPALPCMRGPVALFAFLILAGCTSGASTGVTNPATSSNQASAAPVANATVSDPQVGPIVESLWFNGSTVMSVRVAGIGGSLTLGDLDLPAGATVHMEATWVSPDHLQDVDPYIAFPGCNQSVPASCTTNAVLIGLAPDAGVTTRAGAPGSPDSPAGLDLDAAIVTAHQECNSPNGAFCSWSFGLVSQSEASMSITYSVHLLVTRPPSA